MTTDGKYYGDPFPGLPGRGNEEVKRSILISEKWVPKYSLMDVRGTLETLGFDKEVIGNTVSVLYSTSQTTAAYEFPGDEIIGAVYDDTLRGHGFLEPPPRPVEVRTEYVEKPRCRDKDYIRILIALGMGTASLGLWVASALLK